jgi:hypothetical protein
MGAHQPAAARPRLKPSKLGGLNHLERFLGLPQDAVLSTDAVFVSFALEVASDRRNYFYLPKKPAIRQRVYKCYNSSHGGLQN